MSKVNIPTTLVATDLRNETDCLVEILQAMVGDDERYLIIKVGNAVAWNLHLATSIGKKIKEIMSERYSESEIPNIGGLAVCAVAEFIEKRSQQCQIEHVILIDAPRDVTQTLPLIGKFTRIRLAHIYSDNENPSELLAVSLFSDIKGAANVVRMHVNENSLRDMVEQIIYLTRVCHKTQEKWLAFCADEVQFKSVYDRALQLRKCRTNEPQIHVQPRPHDFFYSHIGGSQFDATFPM